jgi:hypothetical protein
MQDHSSSSFSFLFLFFFFVKESQPKRHGSRIIARPQLQVTIARASAAEGDGVRRIICCSSGSPSPKDARSPEWRTIPGSHHPHAQRSEVARMEGSSCWQRALRGLKVKFAESDPRPPNNSNLAPSLGNTIRALQRATLQTSHVVQSESEPRG